MTKEIALDKLSTDIQPKQRRLHRLRAQESFPALTSKPFSPGDQGPGVWLLVSPDGRLHPYRPPSTSEPLGAIARQ